MDTVESSTETVSVVPTTDGTWISVCSNGLTVLDLLPEGTQKALLVNRWKCFFVLTDSPTRLSLSMHPIKVVHFFVTNVVKFLMIIYKRKSWIADFLYFCQQNNRLMPNPTTKQELLAAINDGYAQLNEQIAKLSEAEAAAPFTINEPQR